MVTGVTYRNPAFLAKAVTTLDVVSSGRAILGIGAAWNEEESLAYGYDWPSTASGSSGWRTRCRSAGDVHAAAVDVPGERHHIEDAYNIPQPVQPGGPKILIGGGGEKKTLRLVAHTRTCGTGSGIPRRSVTRSRYSPITARTSAAIRTEIDKTRLGTLFVATTEEEANARREEFKARRGSTTRAPVDVHLRVADEVGDAVQTFIDAGLDGLIFNMPPGSTPEEVERAGRTLTERFGS